MSEVAGLILAAGESSRIKTHKAVLKIGGKTLLEDQVCRLNQSGINNIYVVVGYNASEIRNSHPKLDVCWIENKNWRNGNFSSVLCGVNGIFPPHPVPLPQGRGGLPSQPAPLTPSLSEGIKGIILLPVDVVGVEVEIIRLIIDEGLRTDCNIVPTFEGRGGHPVYLRSGIVEEISKKPAKGGRLDFMLRDDPKTKRLPVQSRNILNNINTDEDWQGYLAHHCSRSSPAFCPGVPKKT